MARVLMSCLLALAMFAVATSALAATNDGSEFRLTGTGLAGYGDFRSKNYAGYIDLPMDRKAFFWFVESQTSPSTDPLVLWLNGGPGCSSLYGTLQESGPHTMRGPPYQFRENNFTWAAKANVLYLESPPGVGFSLDPHNTLWDDKSTAEANYQFLKGWFDKFPQFKSNAFHIGGESYGGHYVPQLANEILEGDDVALLQRFKGFMVGNPCTGPECRNDREKITGLEEYMRAHGFAPVNKDLGPRMPDEAGYDLYDYLVPTCPNQNMLDMVSWAHPAITSMKRKLSSEHQKYLELQASRRSQMKPAGPPFAETDMGRKTPYPWGPCEGENVHAWINQPDIKMALHAVQNKTWHSCGGIAYNYTQVAIPVIPLYRKFFANTTIDWKIMFYSGTADTIVNFIATQTVVEGFGRPLVAPNGNDQAMSPWYYPYEYDASWPVLGGFYLKWDKVSWAGVRDAGHMVPMFNPPAAKELFESFLETGGPGRPCPGC